MSRQGRLSVYNYRVKNRKILNERVRKSKENRTSEQITAIKENQRKSRQRRQSKGCTVNEILITHSNETKNDRNALSREFIETLLNLK